MIRRIILRAARLMGSLAVTGALAFSASAQSSTAGTVNGTIVAPDKAEVHNARVTIENTVHDYKQSVNDDGNGAFTFGNLPLHNYVLSSPASGFTGARVPVNVRTTVPIAVTIPLTVRA